LQSFEKVYAPFAGVITARNTDIGALINAGAGGVPQELFHMAAVSKLRVYVAVPEVDSQAAQTGAKATLTLDEFPGESIQGTIVRDSDSIDSASRTLNVEVDVDNPQGRIKTGAYVFVHLKNVQLSQANSHSLTIPANTLLFRSEGLRVGIVHDGRAELVPITIGRDFGATVEVVTGLQPTDQVIVNPSDSLTSGSQIRVNAPQVGGSK
jgi:RND family efflux transporter MFP subunit